MLAGGKANDLCKKPTRVESKCRTRRARKLTILMANIIKYPVHVPNTVVLIIDFRSKCRKLNKKIIIIKITVWGSGTVCRFPPRKCATSLDATFSHTYTVYCNVHGSAAHGSTRRARHDLRHRQRSEEHKELHREHAQHHALFRSFPLTVSEWNLLPTPISTTLTLGPEEHKGLRDWGRGTTPRHLPLLPPVQSLNVTSSTPSPRTVSGWNLLPTAISSALSLESFQSRLGRSLHKLQPVPTYLWTSRSCI